MTIEVAWVVDVGLELVLVQVLEVVILEELYAFAVFENLHSGDEYFSFEFAGEGRTHSDDNSNVICGTGFIFFEHLNYVITVNESMR